MTDKIDDGGVIEIPLTKGKLAVVDKSDYGYLIENKWHCSHGYAVSYQGENKPRLYMHRIVNKTPDGLGTDHINGDTLDNRKCNLRTANQSQNSMNRANVGGSSKYKGVSFKKENSKWASYIKVNGRMKHLGYYTDEVEAAIAYNVAANELFGEYAKTNKIADAMIAEGRKGVE